MQQKPHTFVFSTYSFDRATRTASFTYQYLFDERGPQTFTEKVVFDTAADDAHVPDALLDQVLRMVHLTLGVSYYKAYCPLHIKVTYPLSRAQARYWEEVYTKGLGEFFYENKIDFRGRVRFPYDKDYTPPRAVPYKRADRALVGIGGGKDSLVSALLLREQGKEYAQYVLETQKSYAVIENVLSKSDAQTIRVRRFLDEKIVHSEVLPGSYNGHVPISAVYGALGILTALLCNYRWVVTSNEHSANEGNRVYCGETINHQWSKSAAFEHMFQEYVRMYVTPDIVYFSLLRPFYEIRIVQMFIEKGREYFNVFSSCNRNFAITHVHNQQDLWCGKCPKCAFVFLLFAAFLSRDDIVGIFGKNLFTDQSLEPLFRDLLGLGDAKPFECVGTFDESRVAFVMATERFADDYIVARLRPLVKSDDATRMRVFGTAPAPTVPTQFILAGIRTALILGYGTEGRATKSFLEKYYPHIKIATADETDGHDYLERQKDVDIVIKTPGIPQRLVTAHYTTATNLFFARVKGVHTTIGVTGTKGKSTTASLIYAMLKASGMHAQLLGNIGVPMLHALMEDVPVDTVFVIELSSYQLETLRIAPDIAVVLNLFPEHMDHHGSVDAYYNAKKNIVKYQTARDLFLYNDADTRLVQWARTAPSVVRAFEHLSDDERKVYTLPGTHNYINACAAKTAARAVGATPKGIKEALRTFSPLPHRLSYVATVDGVIFYDDAISTTPESTIAALTALDNVQTLILGGLDRGYDYTQLSDAIAHTSVRTLILFPETGKRIAIPKSVTRVLYTESMDEAVAFALKNTDAGGICLLSPGAPSYNLYKNFKERGTAFRNAVRAHMQS